jgi:hypothetical protein
MNPTALRPTARPTTAPQSSGGVVERGGGRAVGPYLFLSVETRFNRKEAASSCLCQ